MLKDGKKGKFSGKSNIDMEAKMTFKQLKVAFVTAEICDYSTQLSFNQ